MRINPIYLSIGQSYSFCTFFKMLFKLRRVGCSKDFISIGESIYVLLVLVLCASYSAVSDIFLIQFFAACSITQAIVVEYVHRILLTGLLPCCFQCCDFLHSHINRQCTTSYSFIVGILISGIVYLTAFRILISILGRALIRAHVLYTLSYNLSKQFFLCIRYSLCTARNSVKIPVVVVSDDYLATFKLIRIAYNIFVSFERIVIVLLSIYSLCAISQMVKVCPLIFSGVHLQPIISEVILTRSAAK